jgi:secreted trypsin-like serine protease
MRRNGQFVDLLSAGWRGGVELQVKETDEMVVRETRKEERACNLAPLDSAIVSSSPSTLLTCAASLRKVACCIGSGAPRFFFGDGEANVNCLSKTLPS